VTDVFGEIEMRESKEEILNDLIPDIQAEASQKVDLDEARSIGDSLGIDWDEIDIDQFRKGMNVEFEHGSRDSETDVTNDDPILTGKIAWAHLKEISNYYTLLDEMETKVIGYLNKRRDKALKREKSNG